ncbi:MAG: YXWGXW repeat-containing protein [Acidobacteriota bacterium]
MRGSKILGAILVGAALPLLVACPPPAAVGVYASIAPPAVRTEYVGAAPGPDYLWVRGYWRWDGAAYGWVPGHFDRRPRERARWVDGRWKHTRQGWLWIDGHWR